MEGRTGRPGGSSDACPLLGRSQPRGAEPSHPLALGGAGAAAQKTPRVGRAHAASNGPIARLPRRFILDDPGARPRIDDPDDDWTAVIHRSYRTPSPTSESARERFEAYLETLQKAVGLTEQIDAYDEASRNRDIVTSVTGSVANSERDRRTRAPWPRASVRRPFGSCRTRPVSELRSQPGTAGLTRRPSAASTALRFPLWPS